MREKVGKSRNTVFFQWFGAPEGRKVGSLKLRVRSQLARWEMKNCTPLWREAHLQVKMYKTPQLRTTFGSWDVEKVHAVVARSTFPSQNVQNTPGSDHFWQLRCKKVHAIVARSTFRSENVQNTPWSDHFWQLRCRKSARRCGAKHISKWKCTKHTILGPLLEVEMSKKCTALWREAHFEVKMYKTLHVRATFGGADVEKVHAVVAQTTFRSKNVQNTRGSDHFWRLRCRFASLHYITPHYTPQHYNHNYTTTQLHSTTLIYTPLHSTTLNYTPLHYTTFHYTSLHYITLHSTTTTQLHSTTLNYTTLHYITLHYTPLHYITLHYTTFHYTSLHDTKLHSTKHYNYNYNYTPLHSTTLNYTTLTTLHYTTLHYIPLHSTTLHYTTLHYTEWHCTTDRQVDR